MDARRGWFAVLSPCAGLFVAGTLSASMVQAASVRSSQCPVSQLSLGFDDEGGAFNGMSQSGTLLVLRNIGRAPCRVRALPRLHFEDADGRAVDAVRRAPPGMHPGPVLSSVQVMPGAALTARLHWVSGDVYDGHHCISPATAVIDLPGGTLRQSFGRHMCAPAGSARFFDQAPLRPDTAPPAP